MAGAQKKRRPSLAAAFRGIEGGTFVRLDRFDESRGGSQRVHVQVQE
jgi:hypothetical protein